MEVLHMYCGSDASCLHPLSPIGSYLYLTHFWAKFPYYPNLEGLGRSKNNSLGIAKILIIYGPLKALSEDLQERRSTRN